MNRIPRDNTAVPLPPRYPDVSANSLISTFKEPTDNWGGEHRHVKTHSDEACKSYTLMLSGEPSWETAPAGVRTTDRQGRWAEKHTCVLAMCPLCVSQAVWERGLKIIWGFSLLQAKKGLEVV